MLTCPKEIDEQGGAPERANEPVFKWKVTCARPVTLVVTKQSNVMIDWRRIAVFFRIIAVAALCFGLIGGLIAAADIAFELSLGEWLFESSVGKLVGTFAGVSILFLVVKTLFPSILKDIQQRGD